jgi:hypothetical protein
MDNKTNKRKLRQEREENEIQRQLKQSVKS